MLACVVAVGMSSAIAQEQTRIQFEVTIDGSIVARPEIRVPSGGEGRMELDEVHGEERVIFTPTIRGDDIAIALRISSGQAIPAHSRDYHDRSRVPRVDVWDTRAQAIRLTVSLVH